MYGAYLEDAAMTVLLHTNDTHVTSVTLQEEIAELQGFSAESRVQYPA